MNPLSGEEANGVSVVVSYFNPKKDARVVTMTELALRSLGQFTKAPLELILSDGTGQVDPYFDELCGRSGWLYRPSQVTETFAQTYNRGMSFARHYYRAWMASDIFVGPDWDALLIGEMKRTGASMAVPYLSTADFGGQIASYVISRRTFYPAAMTLNLNLVTADLLDRVGLLDERFSGCFNDLDYLIRIRQQGLYAIVADAGNITHLGLGTRTASTSVRYENDQRIFRDKYSDLKFGAIADHDLELLFQSSTFFQLRRLVWQITSRERRAKWMNIVDRLEPIFHRA